MYLKKELFIQHNIHNYSLAYLISFIILYK
jgi:hypothetical protein